MTVSIRDQLAELPNGQRLPTLDWMQVAKYLRDHYIGARAEQDRRERAARRQRLYMATGDADMEAFIRRVISDPLVQEKRLAFVGAAKFCNVLRRVTHELATVYTQPATRTVADVASNARYQEVQRRSRQHEVMVRVNRLALLHRAILVGPRVRTVNGVAEPVLDVVTPDCFHAIGHPLDPTALIALLIDLRLTPASSAYRKPKYALWTATELAYLDDQGMLLAEPTLHGYARMPWLLLNMEPPSGGLVDSSTGDDLEAAHLAVWFEQVLLLKESKSYTTQHVITGDGSRMAREQAADSDVPIELSEGQTVTTIDNRMDLSAFSTTARIIFETAAANYGLPPSLLSHAGVQSAEARELMRVPLREIRLAQQIPFRDFERSLVELQAMVIGRGMPELAFSTDGWAIDFADPQTPLSAKEALEIFKQERQLGLTSTLAELLRRNPDLTELQARQLLMRFVADEVARNVAMRPLAEISGSQGAELPEAEPQADPTEVAA